MASFRMKQCNMLFYQTVRFLINLVIISINEVSVKAASAFIWNLPQYLAQLCLQPKPTDGDDPLALTVLFSPPFLFC